MELKQVLTKLYYTIGEVADFYKVNTSLIRYWEKEFHNLHPKKNKSGVRKYTQKDIEEFGKVYELVKEKGFTIEGAKKELKSRRHSKEELSSAVPSNVIPNNIMKTFDKQSLLDKLTNTLKKLQDLKSELESSTSLPSEKLSD